MKGAGQKRGEELSSKCLYKSGLDQKRRQKGERVEQGRQKGAKKGGGKRAGQKGLGQIRAGQKGANEGKKGWDHKPTISPDQIILSQ